MKPSNKYATIFAVVATLTSPATFAAKSDDWYPTKSNTSVTWNASGSAVYSSGKFKDTVDQFRDFNDLGSHISLQDVRANLDIMSKALKMPIGLRIGLEHNSEDLSVDASSDLKSFADEVLVGVAPHDNAIVLFGRGKVPFGGDSSRRAIDRNNPIHRALEQNERKVIAVLAVDPSFIQALNKIKGVDLKSVEIAKFASTTNPDDLKFNNSLDSEAIRAIALIGPVLTQASYMKVNGIERQMSVSGEMGVSTTITGPLTLYAEYLSIRDSQSNGGDLNLYTMGVEKESSTLSRWLKRPTSAFVEATRVSNKTDRSASNGAATGIKVQATERIQLAGEYSTHAPGTQGLIGAEKDPTVTVRATVKRKGKAARTNLFPYARAKKSAQDAAVDAMRAGK